MDLPRGKTELSSDDSLIIGVVLPDGGKFTVGTFNITKFTAYDERGQMSNVPWLAAFDKNDRIVMRIPASCVAVVLYQNNI